jgi:hypothetical protein
MPFAIAADAADVEHQLVHQRGVLQRREGQADIGQQQHQRDWRRQELVELAHAPCPTRPLAAVFVG